MAFTIGAPLYSAVKPMRRCTRGRFTRAMVATFRQRGAWFSRLRTLQLARKGNKGIQCGKPGVRFDTILIFDCFTLFHHIPWFFSRSFNVLTESLDSSCATSTMAFEVVMLLSFYWWHQEFSEIAGDEEVSGSTPMNEH